MILVKINLTMVCDKCHHKDIWDNYFWRIETKDDLSEPYDEFLTMAKEKGWESLDGKFLCPECALKIRLTVD